MAAPGDQVAMWQLFRAGGPLRARPEIHASWRRPRSNGVDPDRLGREHTEIDPEQLLVRAGAPILLAMSDQLVVRPLRFRSPTRRARSSVGWEAHD